MAGWGDDWGFDWGNAVEDTQLTAFPIQVSSAVYAPTVLTPDANVALSRIAVLATVRVPTVNSTNVTAFTPGQPFAITRTVNVTQTISRTVTAGVGS